MARLKGFTLTDKFVAFRCSAGLTQADVAAAAGTHQTTVANLEAGRETMSRARAERIAKAVGVTVDLALKRGLFRKPSRRGGEARA